MVPQLEVEYFLEFYFMATSRLRFSGDQLTQMLIGGGAAVTMALALAALILVGGIAGGPSTPDDLKRALMAQSCHTHHDRANRYKTQVPALLDKFNGMIADHLAHKRIKKSNANLATQELVAGILGCFKPGLAAKKIPKGQVYMVDRSYAEMHDPIIVNAAALYMAKAIILDSRNRGMFDRHTRRLIQIMKDNNAPLSEARVFLRKNGLDAIGVNFRFNDPPRPSAPGIFRSIEERMKQRCNPRDFFLARPNLATTSLVLSGKAKYQSPASCVIRNLGQIGTLKIHQVTGIRCFDGPRMWRCRYTVWASFFMDPPMPVFGRLLHNVPNPNHSYVWREGDQWRTRPVE